MHAKQKGRAINLAAALIAGTAKVHGLTLATRNVDDFSGISIDVLNPWMPRGARRETL
jgi:hypothetical protein